MDDIIAVHKQGEQTLRYLTVIAERTREGIAVLDFNGTVRFVNTAWAAMHRYKTSEELIGKQISAFHTKEQMKTDVIPFIEEAKRRGQLAGPVEHIRRNGTTLPTEMLMVVFKDQAGKAVGLIAFATDLTEQEQTKDELKRYRNRLAELVKQQTDELTATNEHLQYEITKRKQVEGHLKQQTDELKAANEQLQYEIAQHEQAERDLRRQTAELTTANEQLQDQISEHERAKNELQEYADEFKLRLKQQTDELKAVNEQLQHEIAQHEEAERNLKRQTAELTTTNEQLQDQISEHERAKNELQEYRNQLEQRLRKQSDELTFANEHLQHEITNRKQVEENLKQQTDELKAASERLQDLINKVRARGHIVEVDMRKAIGSFEADVSPTNNRKAILKKIFRENIRLQKPDFERYNHGMVH